MTMPEIPSSDSPKVTARPARTISAPATIKEKTDFTNSFIRNVPQAISVYHSRIEIGDHESLHSQREARSADYADQARADIQESRVRLSTFLPHSFRSPSLSSMTISTRRFSWRPLAVSFDECGCDFPNPFLAMISAETP